MATIVKQTGLAKFGGDNYTEWAKSMRAVMLEKELWEAVRDRPEDRPKTDDNEATKAEWAKKKNRAYAILHLSLDEAVLVLVDHCKTA
ncbi:DUF4219 domain-containing protein, partial [bacterium]|nr:DUF4219 domain-containing protein [bacterium]